VLDDFLKNIEEAESKTFRDKTWDSFSTDLMTRRAPVHAVVIVANRWHVDDICGRIKNRNDPKHKDYDPEFPKFRTVKFPAQDPKTKKWLFGKRFGPSWYSTLKASLGTYSWNALGLQNPKPRSGNMLKADRVKILRDADFDAISEGAKWCRGYDIASTQKEKAKSDPDFSVGTLAGFKEGRVFVSHMIAGQWEALTRDKIIEDNLLRDGSNVPIRIECVAGYKDTYVRVKAALSGRAAVHPYLPKHDKVARATFLESYFEAGEVYLRLADWNQEWIDEMLEFPSGTHDDRVDSLVTALHDLMVRSSTFRLTR
jgi:predicted phage terminase large subunit-like protein